MTAPQAQGANVARSTAVTGKGVIFSITVVQDAPAGFVEQSPYIVALVALENGRLVTAQITDCETTPTIGTSVEMVTRKLTTEGKRGIIVYGYKFRPLLNS